jgi:hypothetical protein
LRAAEKAVTEKVEQYEKAIDTILSVGTERKRDAVLVSRDEKSDWLYRSGNTALYPRFDLVDEYRRASDSETITRHR